MRWISVALIFTCLFCWSWLACRRASQIETSEATDNLGSVSADNPKLYERVQTAEDWKNPFLQIQGDVVSIRAHGNRTEVPVGQVVRILRALPAADWPYGRVVAVQARGGPQTSESALLTEQTRVQLEALLKINDIEIDDWP